jgi:hypothetical protein
MPPGTAISSNRAGRPTAQNRRGRLRGREHKLPAVAPKAWPPRQFGGSPGGYNAASSGNTRATAAARLDTCSRV